MRSGALSSTIINTAMVASALGLASCAATQTAIEHHGLVSNTRLSKTVFLDPVLASQKTIYLTVKNTSDQTLDINKPLAEALTSHGYRIVNSPNQSHYLLQANIRSLGKMSQSASQNALGGGYGSALAGAGTGAAIGALSGSSNSALAGGILGGVVGLAADSLVKDVNYTMITDVQISVRAGRGVTVRENFRSSLENGTSSGSYQTSSRNTEFQHYRTRIVSNVDKVNLSFDQARPALEQGLVKTLAGIF